MRGKRQRTQSKEEEQQTQSTHCMDSFKCISKRPYLPLQQHWKKAAHKNWQIFFITFWTFNNNCTKNVKFFSHIRIPKIFWSMNSAGGIPFRWTLSLELLLPPNQGIPLTFSGWSFHFTGQPLIQYFFYPYFPYNYHTISSSLTQSM